MFDAEPIKRKLRIAGQCYSRISGLSVEGFKAFGDTQNLRIAPITLVFGVNSSGKSALIQAMSLLREMLLTDNADVRYPGIGGRQIDLGGFNNYRSKWAKNKNIKFTLSYEDIDDPGKHYEYGISIGENRLNDNQWLWQEEGGKTLEQTVNEISIDGYGISIQMRMPLFLDGIENMQFPFSYNMDWDLFTVNDDGLDYLTSERLLRNLTASDSQYSARASESRLDYILAIKWLLYQEELVSVLARGRKSGLDSFMSGGYFEGDAWDDYTKVFYPSSIFYTEHEARKSLREFLELEISSLEETESVTLTEERFESIWTKAITGIPNGLTRLSNEAFREYFSLLSSMKYLGPIREIPGRSFTDRFSHLDFGQEATGISTYAQIRDNRELLGSVNRWLSGKLFKKEYLFRSIETVPVGSEITDRRRELRFYERSDDKDTEMSLRDVGSGIAQIVPVIVLCLGNTRKTLLIEQPELHLHPSGAAEMGDLLIESALGNKNTIIAETHSEHLILRILRRIRQTSEGTLPSKLVPITPNDVSVVFVQPKADGKGSEIVQIPVTEDGDILFGWPEGFMPDRLQELF